MTGNQILLEDIMRLHFDKQLNWICEENLRKKYGPDGFFFQIGGLKINRNIGFLRDGLVCRFDPYEIAPFSSGTIEVFVSWEEVKHLMKPEWVVKLCK
jgi:hypothetical protein